MNRSMLFREELLLSVLRKIPQSVVVEGEEPVSHEMREFASQHPGRYISVGLSEQSLLLVAAGIALEGAVVLAGSHTPLLLPRGYEQIRNCIALPRLPVLIFGPAGGFACGHEGAPFQLVEDLGLMRLMPEMHVLVPSDRDICEKLLFDCALRRVPAYIRALPALSVESSPIYAATEWSGPVKIGGARVLREGDGVTLCSYGMMIPQLLSAARVLSRQGIEAEVLDCYCIKPLPEELLLSSVRRTGCCVVVEEHAQSGSLGEALGALFGRHFPVPLLSVNIGCSFGQSGTPGELMSYYSLHSQDVVGAATRAWGMRRRL